MPPIAIFYSFVIFGMFAYWLAARWYLVPWLERQTLYEALKPFALFHAFRYVGLGFLAGPDVAGPMNQSLLNHIAWGDMVAAVLALAAALALNARAPRALALGLVWAFNLAGFLDLTIALARGTLLSASGYGMAAAGPWPYLIVGFYVPALLTTHLMVFTMLLNAGNRPEPQSDPAPQ